MARDALSFASTKIQPPRLRSGWLARDTLVAHIAQGLLQSRLTLVSAAGGFGKSCAMAQTLASPTSPARALRCAWIACDEGDTLAVLCSALVAALEPFDLPWRHAPEALIGALGRGDATRAFRDALVNALAATDVPRAVIVFDDLHRLIDPRAQEFLAALPPSLPEHWGLALLTRVDPPWSLARLRASGELTEVRQDELRFGEAEIEALARDAGRIDAAAALLARTEGWPVGVTLALAGPRTASPVRNARHAIDYLRSEVLDHLPAGLREFLVRTSVLPELTPARAAALTGRPDAASCLDEIERRGLFYQEVESSERTLRLHDIFRDALEAERQRLPPAELQALWRRAADTEPDAARRFDFLLHAADPAAATHTLTQEAPALIAAGMIDAVQDMLGRLPPDWLAQSPEVAMLRGVMAWEAMDLQGMQDQMKHAARVYALRGDGAGHDLARAYVALAINGMSPIGSPRTDPAYEVVVDERTAPRTRVIVALHRAWHAFDLADFDATHRHYTELLDRMQDDPDSAHDPALWYQVTPGMAYFGVRALEPLLGRYADGALRVAGEDYPALRAIGLSVRGGVALWRGALAEARAQLDEAASLAAWVGHPHTLSVYAHIARLICRTAQGEFEAARTGFQDAMAQVSDMTGDDGRGPGWYFHWYELRCCLMAERHDLAREALEALRRSTPASVTQTHTGVLRIIDAYQAWLAGDLAGAQVQMHAALAPYGHNDAVGTVTALRMQRAGLCLQLGELTTAAQALREALDGVRLRGYALSARFAGDGLLRRLAASPLLPSLDATQRATLAALVPGQAAPATLALRPSTVDGIEPISPREREVLALLAAGDSNKLIARRLDLSPHTVKRHVANILGKLGVESRGQAAARYPGLNS